MAQMDADRSDEWQLDEWRLVVTQYLSALICAICGQ
jgi:hypothetical protein